MHVWLDDVRPAPVGWCWVKEPEEAIRLLESGGVEEVSLDHDLGLFDLDGRERTGYDVLLWLEERVAADPCLVVPTIRIHSANAAAWRRMDAAVESIRRLAGRAGSGDGAGPG